MIAQHIKTVAHGERITAPGVYRMPMGWYHADCCAGPSISSSGLRKIELDCPAEYWDTSPYNPDRAESAEDGVEAAYFRIGRAAHTMVLEPETFAGMFVTRPAIFTDWRTKQAREWRAAQAREGFTVMDPPEMIRVQGIAKAIREHPLTRDGLWDGEIECAIIWKDAKTGLWLKARPDSLPRSARLVADLKVAASAHPLSVRRSIREFGYDMQLALVGIGLKAVLNMTIEDYALFVVGASRPHSTFLQVVSHEAIRWAQRRLRRGLDTFARCLKESRWPSYEERDGEQYSPDARTIERFEQERKAGLLPKEW